jgi:hypothetical protein
MKVETIEKIFNFLQNNEGKKLPKSWFKSLEKLKLIEELETLPDGVQYKYERSLFLNDSNITKLPDNLYVVGSLDLDNSELLTKLPDNLHVDGFLIIKRCYQLTELPDNLYVGINLYIRYTPLADKYTDEEIYEMITSKGGTLIGQIIR